MQSISPNQRYYQERSAMIVREEAKGNNIYPHKFDITSSLPQYINTYNHIEANESLENEIECIAGRIMRVNAISEAAIFYDIQANGEKLQIFARLNDFHVGVEANDEFIEQHRNIRRGDIIGVIGYPARTRRGELSIYATNIVLLSPCLRMLPRNHYKYRLRNQETRYRQRYLDLILREETREIFYTRSKIISFIRRFLDSRGFLEVETPILNQMAGGGNAKKFETMHNSLNLPMYLRIAPELYLKQLVIGGLDRVYEIGRQFRNESDDRTHNPEFTSCEFYAAYWDYNDLMNITEEMISRLVYELNGCYKIEYHDDEEEVIEIDFSTPWPRYNMIQEIENNGGFKIPRPLTSNQCNQFLKDRCNEFGILPTTPYTTTRMLDTLCGYFIESKINNPSFITCHPVIMSPLAKNHRNDTELTERFECFIMGKEICNAYTELNDPKIQRERFREQRKDKNLGDDEAMDYDENYCKALEYGLPPTAGWGIGIDRLTMFLTDSNTIKEVLLFPQMKPVININNNNNNDNNEWLLWCIIAMVLIVAVLIMNILWIDVIASNSCYIDNVIGLLLCIGIIIQSQL